MLGQLINILIMAIGIATGNVSSNAYKGGNVLNTSQEKTKPTKKNAVQQYSEDYEIGSLKGSYSYTIAQGNPTLTEFRKYYLKQTGNTTDYGYMQLADIGMIYNTVYTFSYGAGSEYVSRTIIYLKIETYTTSYTSYLMSESIEITSTGWGVLQRRMLTGRTNEANELLDLTMTANTLTLVDTKLSNTNVWIVEEDYTTNNPTQNTTVNLNYRTNNYELEDNTTKYVVLDMIYSNPTSVTISSDIQNVALTIDGTYLADIYNYEVIDIPGLMFTVITMPFSFISAAFNLTIFPGTPYQINFANLFMVILATFILLWLIRKVFH